MVINKMKYTAFFFPNGNIAVTDGENQIPELQRKSVPAMFAEHIESKGYNPAEFLLSLTAGYAIFVKSKSGGWNWEFVNT